MKAKSTSVLFLVVLSITGYAQLIDEEFRPLITTTAEIGAFAVQPDGKVIVGGDIVLAGDKPVNHFIRLNTDGSPDESFMPPDFMDKGATIQTILVDNAGKILVGGSFGNESYAVRLHPDGSLDESFALSSAITNVIKIESYGEDQYMVLSFSHPSNLALVNNDGSIDPSFNVGTGPNGFGINGTDFTVLSDGGVLFAGSFSQFNGADHNRIVRLNPDGSVDNTFSIGTGPQGSTQVINSAKVQSDGKILLAGKFESFNDANAVNLVRLHPDGSVDESFVIPGPSANFFSSGIGAMTLVDDNIFLAGLNQDFVSGVLQFRVMKLNSDGSLVNEFTAPVSDMTANGVVHDPILVNGPDGIFLSANFSRMGADDRRGIALLDRTTGELSADFDPPIGGLPIVRTVREDADGNIFIGGRFHFVNGVRSQNIAKLHPDGSLDEVFAANIGAGPDQLVNCIELDSDGRILVGGGMLYFDNSYSGNLVRLNPDGTLDGTFAANVYTNSVGWGVKALHLMSDGKLIIGGHFDHINNQPMKALARLESDGTTDATFVPPSFDANQVVNAIALMDDNNLLIGGNRWSGTYGGFLYQTDALGTIVNNFPGVDLSNQSIMTIKLLPSGGFLAAGTFSQSFSSSTPNPLLQFNSEGTLVDKISVVVYDEAIEDIMLIPDDYVLLAGYFRKVNSVPSSGLTIIRLNGQLSDAYSFDVAGFTAKVYQSVPGSSTFIMCGSFSSVNGIPAFGIAKVNIQVPATPTDIDYEIDNTEGQIVVSWSDHAFNETGFEISREVEGVTTIIATEEANTTTYVDLTAEPLNTYTYRIRAINAGESSNDSEAVTVSTSEWVPPTAPGGLTHHIADNFSTVEISWTDTSDNEKGFELERAQGDGDFSQINLTGPDVTVFTDEFSFDTHTRYRIRSYNKFGTSAYSPVVELPVILDVHESESTAVSAYPNPADGALYIDHDFQSPVRITLQDMAGKTLRDQSHDGAIITLDLNDVPPGLYLVRVQGENRSKVMKVQKL